MRTADQQPDEYGPTVAHRNAPCRVCNRTISADEEAYGRKCGNGTRYRHKECRIDVPDPSDEGSQQERKLAGYHYDRGTNTNYGSA